MPAGNDRFFRDLPRNIYKILKPEQADVLAGRADAVHARNAIILSAISLGPLTAFFISGALVINTKIAAMPELTLNACLLYPLTGIAAVVIGLMAYRRGRYGLAIFSATVLPAVNIGVIIGGFAWWAVA